MSLVCVLYVNLALEFEVPSILVEKPTAVKCVCVCVCAHVQYKEKRVEQEKDLLQGQVTWLSEELKAKSEELLLLSREKGSEILELKCSLSNKDDEV